MPATKTHGGPRSGCCDLQSAKVESARRSHPANSLGVRSALSGSTKGSKGGGGGTDRFRARRGATPLFPVCAGRIVERDASPVGHASWCWSSCSPRWPSAASARKASGMNLPLPVGCHRIQPLRVRSWLQANRPRSTTPPNFRCRAVTPRCVKTCLYTGRSRLKRGVRSDVYTDTLCSQDTSFEILLPPERLSVFTVIFCRLKKYFGDDLTPC